MPEFQHSGPIEAEVSIPVGSINVTAEERESVLVEVTAQDGSDDSRAAAEKTKVEFNKGKLKVEFPRKRFSYSPPAISVEAHIPLNSSVELKTATADIRCEGIFGDVEINSASGPISLGDATGDTKVQSASGDIRMGDIGGNLKVKSASGDVTVGAVGGKAKVRSASGEIGIDSVGSDLEVESASGDVRVDSVKTGKSQVRTVSGDVTIAVVQGTGVWLDFNSLSGSIESSLEPVDSSSAGHDLSIHVRTVSGYISVKRAAEPVTA